MEILVYDPYLSEWEAGELGVKKADLDDLFVRSDFVSLHAPSIPETSKMVGEIRKAMKGKSFIGGFVAGEQGNIPGYGYFHGNLMSSTVVFSQQDGQSG